MEKEDVIKLLSQKINGNLNLSYDRLSSLTGYSKRQLIRLAKNIETKGIESCLTHGNIGLTAHNRADSSEIDYLRKFKKQYPKITIAQFRDFYLEDIIYNSARKNDIQFYQLKERSLSFFQRLFKQEGWISPIKHKSLKSTSSPHLLRQRSARTGALVQIDGTPFDWFNDGRMYCLHLAVDDATSEVLAGWFCKNESQFGYCMMMKILIRKNGIPMSLYSDKHSIFRNHLKDSNLTQFGMMMEELGIEMIFANTPQAKGRIERYNGTAQSRLPNDIIRFKIKDYDELNGWFNNFYIDYLNKKFAYIALDPHSEFVEIEGTFDLDIVFTRKEDREILSGNMISYNGFYYIPHDENGEVIKILKGTKIKVYDFVFEPKICIKYLAKLYECTATGISNKNKQTIINNQKELEYYLNLKNRDLD